jgi:hypothetical protein
MSEPLIKDIHKVTIPHSMWGMLTYAINDQVISLDKTITGVITGISFYTDINLAVEVNNSGDWYPIEEFQHLV